MSVLSSACGAEMMQGHFVVTGGYDPSQPEWALTTVAKYSPSGFVGYLPAMPGGRYGHACSRYISSKGEEVRIMMVVMRVIVMMI